MHMYYVLGEILNKHLNTIQADIKLEFLKEMYLIVFYYTARSRSIYLHDAELQYRIHQHRTGYEYTGRE